MLTLSAVYYLSREWIADALLAVAHAWGSGWWLTVCQTDMLLLVCDSSLWPATSPASLNLDGASGLSPNLLSHDLPSARTRELVKSETETDDNFFSVPKIWGAHDGCMESGVPRVYKLSGRCATHPSQPRQRNPTRWSSASCSWLPPWLPSLMVRRSIRCRFICAWFWCKDTSPHPLTVQYLFFFCHAA